MAGGDGPNHRGAVDDGAHRGAVDDGALLVPPVTVQARRIPFSDLRDQQFLGEGSFGTVYAAQWGTHTVAVKILHDNRHIPLQQLKCDLKEEVWEEGGVHLAQHVCTHARGGVCTRQGWCVHTPGVVCSYVMHDCIWC